jgi:hypothetical protein
MEKELCKLIIKDRIKTFLDQLKRIKDLGNDNFLVEMRMGNCEFVINRSIKILDSLNGAKLDFFIPFILSTTNIFNAWNLMKFYIIFSK